MKCDKCEQLRINGVVCHETGCPNMGATWDIEREQWIHYLDCFTCGYPVERGKRCDCTMPDNDWGEDDEDEEQPEPDWVCVDCIQAIANDDFSGLDYYYDKEESDRREAQIRAAVYTDKGYWVCGDQEPLTFSSSSCDCCGSWLAGERHAAHYIENKESEV